MADLKQICDLELIEQRPFNVNKYYMLAYGTNQAFVDAVEAHWNDWIQTVKEASWLHYWINYDRLNQDSCTPKGQLIDQEVDTVQLKGLGTIRAGNIASLIYTKAVWGWGIEDWLHKPTQRAEVGKPVNRINKSIIKVRNAPMWNELCDLQFFKETGLLIPKEYADLDRWLEQLWNQVQIICT